MSSAFGQVDAPSQLEDLTVEQAKSDLPLWLGYDWVDTHVIDLFSKY